MTPDTQAYLTKAHESLASAGAEVEARRHNSASNRAYYASFQAAVAVLIAHGVVPQKGSWEHRFVQSQFSGKLIVRRKIIPARFRGVLERLLELRVRADYQPEFVSRVEAQRAVREASAFVHRAGDTLKKGDIDDGT